MSHPSLEKLTTKELATMEANVRRILESGASDKRSIAEERLKLIAAEKNRRHSSREQKTSDFRWGKRVDRKYGPSIAYFKGTQVAEVRKDENHNSHNKDVYTVYIEGERFQRFRHIAEARKKVETEFFRRLQSKGGK